MNNNNVQKKLNLMRHIELEVKFGVIITDLLMTCYVLWLIITNDSSWIPGAILGFTPFGAIELIRAGRLFNLCINHKLMIVHIMGVYGCCIYQAYYGFGEILGEMRVIMFLSGLLLLLNALRIKYYGRCCKESCCKEDIA